MPRAEGSVLAQAPGDAGSPAHSLGTAVLDGGTLRTKSAQTPRDK